MANTIASIYRKFDFETRNQAVLKQFRFIKSQLDNSETRLNKSEEGIKEFKENRNFLSLRIEASTVTRSLQAVTRVVNRMTKGLSKIRDAGDGVGRAGRGHQHRFR